ncbi:MAG TPA: hypothetical protein VFE05_12565 [Longimicrobiaceae bacterium]|jgi:hypothetical protein|nr:hypothetical protein [Longimicrobiaceae bacterium]
MAKLGLKMDELAVESFETGAHGNDLRGAGHEAVGTRIGCPATAYVTCPATPRAEDFRVTNLCC